MATHVIPASVLTAPSGAGPGSTPPPAVTAPAPVTAPRGAWLALSAAFTDAVTDLTEREDLTVQCAPGLGRGAPGCFVPSLATIELDGTHLGQQPATCDPTRPADRDRYPALWGVLTHEAAHAAHTRWGLPNSVPAAAAEAALALEESRIEASDDQSPYPPRAGRLHRTRRPVGWSIGRFAGHDPQCGDDAVERWTRRRAATGPH